MKKTLVHKMRIAALWFCTYSWMTPLLEVHGGGRACPCGMEINGLGILSEAWLYSVR
ncbi:hypothetical protein [Terribacillus sp. 7520-G]|uniref:hypothetical protein n=1 Tax=Terribacillus TaxID=459532 RepID=UPI0013044987|nr:hypothetical protein [Terribacillus sp. 7520-G]